MPRDPPLRPCVAVNGGMLLDLMQVGRGIGNEVRVIGID
jgi:hypothetical protein